MKKLLQKNKSNYASKSFGQPADLDVIQDIGDQYSLKVIIDGAQSFGSTYNHKTDSNLGNISTTSFFPSKPLGCYGDGGAFLLIMKNMQIKLNYLEYMAKTNVIINILE